MLASPDASEIVLSPGNAAVMTKLMQGVVQSGTSSSVTLDKRTECAGKTGTTQNNCDRWFVGYTPDIICGVWCGFAYPETMKGGNLCTGIWNHVMHQILDAKGGRTEFDLPGDLVQMSYCKDSGYLADDACLFDPRGKRTETGWFVAGSEPRHSCDRHILCRMDPDGGVSHGYCPEEALRQAALLRVIRHFPVQVTVTDAQYVWRGDPHSMPPNPNTGQGYFEAYLPDFCGKSNLSSPFNRSCIRHLQETPDSGSATTPGSGSNAVPETGIAAVPEFRPPERPPAAGSETERVSPRVAFPEAQPTEEDRKSDRNKRAVPRIW